MIYNVTPRSMAFFRQGKYREIPHVCQLFLSTGCCCRGVILKNGCLLIFPVILPVFARCMHGSLFTYGDRVKNDIYKDDQSAEDILRCDCQIRRVDYHR